MEGPPSQPRSYVGEHKFEATNLYLPTTCRQCDQFVWSFARAVQCRECQYIAHAECALDAPKECFQLRGGAEVTQQGTATTTIQTQPAVQQLAIVPQFNRHNIVKEGKLLKMALFDGSWSTVWCILKGEALYIFRPQNKPEVQYTTPIATIVLTKEDLEVSHVTSLNKKYGFGFYVNNQDYYFAALSKEDLRDWLDAIRNKRQKLLYAPDTGEEIYNKTSNEILASFLLFSQVTRPFEFAWEDTPKRKITVLDIQQLLDGTELRVSTWGILPELDLTSLDKGSKEEIYYFRTKMARVASLQSSQERVRVLTAEITDAPVPPSFPLFFLVLFRFGRSQYRIKCAADRTLYEIMTAEVLMRLQPLDMSVSWATPNPENYVVRLGRCNEYLFDTRCRLLSLVYVRECITRSKPIEFDLVEYEPLLSKIGRKTNVVTEPAPLKQSFCSIEAEINLLHLPVLTPSAFDIEKMSQRFELRVTRVDNFTKSALYATNKFFSNDIETDNISLFVVAAIYNGGELLVRPMYTQPVSGKPEWNELLMCESLNICNIPREARICFTFFACLGDNGGLLSKMVKLLRGGYTEFVPLGWVNFSWVDFRGVVKTGAHSLRLWPSTSSIQNPLATCCSNFDPKSLSLVIDINSSAPLPIIFPDEPERAKPSQHGDIPVPNQQDIIMIQRIIGKDALYSLPEHEKMLIWTHRYYIKEHMPAGLSKVLLSGAWNVRSTVQEIHSFLKTWPELRPIDALELLDVRFPDSQVRRFAVKCLAVLSDRELVEYLPQLVQVTKSETYHYSALSEFLLLRAIRSIVVAHPLFWHLQAELHTPIIVVRFRLYIEAMLSGTGDADFAKALQKEMKVVNDVAQIALEVKTLPNPAERQEVLRSRLQKLNYPDVFGIPNNPKYEATHLLVSKCRVMDSFTKPLWLVYTNKEQHNTQVIFKAGDDLRTDILALQMIRIMDGLWKAEGLDLHMQPYRAVSTGEGLGMIEVITDSQTTSAIQQLHGGGGALSAFTPTALRDWLQNHNPTEKAFEDAVNNFTLSCAGYCVATYILGIGDRHNDNIMCSLTGNMFHIDFGYFLGQRVTFAGIPRETTPFVLTAEFAHVMGGEHSPNFRRFVQHCCKAYNIIRKHGHLFITLFVMMLSSGIEQVRTIEDLYYLRDVLALDLSEEDAANRFTQLIAESLSNQVVKFNNAVHIHFHPK
eukprot:TRINITY_DN3491_c0_g1_i1.p1 TRINITY_DN3491_c0_g1~~TRINITY_DN3491_c0_g1_i1.p1  ORF type:complete len:1193 (-),score=145.86 TRINITY_DN3491_c0_g1_i1:18-3596(-)